MAASDEHAKPDDTPTSADTNPGEDQAADGEPSARDVVLAKSKQKRSKGHKDGDDPNARTRPPAWLIVLTIAIPITVGTMWYSNWYGRPLSCEEVASQLDAEGASGRYHALTQVHEKIHAWHGLPQAQKDAYYDQALRGCVDPVLTFAESSMSEEPGIGVYAALLRTLGSMAYLAVRQPADAAEARSLLEDIFNRTRTSPRADGNQRIVRGQAACSLAQHGDDRPIVLEALLLMLDDSEVTMRGNAATALGIVGNANTAAALKRVAENDPDPQVRALAEAAYIETQGKLP